MDQPIVDDKIARRARHSWYFYDFGNSAYAAVILLAVFSVYFSSVVADHVRGPSLWNLAVGIAAILVAVMSPILGTIADFSKAKKKFLFVFTCMAVIFTALLFFVKKGDVAMGMTFFILAEIGYRASQVFYDALLVDVSTPQSIGSISGKGWALGMLGGIACLILVLVPITLVNKGVIPVPFGDGTFMPRLSFIITAIFFAVASLPTFLHVKQINEPEKLPAGETTIGYAFKKLASTFRDIKHYREFIKYAIAFLIYNDGIMMLMDNAAIIAAILFGFKTEELIILIIILQIAGAGGAFLFGWISNKHSSKQAITYALIMLVAVVVSLIFVKEKSFFYVIGALAGFSLSGVQAVSRTMVSQLSPQSKTTEFYGFLSVAGRTSTFIGPWVFGSVYLGMTRLYQARGLTDAAAKSNGILFGVGAIILSLIIGGCFLFFVRRVTHKDPLKFD